MQDFEFDCCLRVAVMMGKVQAIPKEKCKDRFLVQSADYDGVMPNDKFEVTSLSLSLHTHTHTHTRALSLSLTHTLTQTRTHFFDCQPNKLLADKKLL